MRGIYSTKVDSLDLSELFASSSDKNDIVLSFNKAMTKDGLLVSEIGGGLCEVRGEVFENEALQELFKSSDISYRPGIGCAYLTQNSSMYKVQSQIQSMGDTQVVYYLLDFNTIEPTREVNCLCTPTLVVDRSLLDDQLSYMYSVSETDNIENANLIDGIINLLEEIRESCEEV